jgi:hypothetical protein
MLYVVDTTGTDMNIVNTVTINIRRQHRGITEQHYNEKMLKMCGLKQVKLLNCLYKYRKKKRNISWNNESIYESYEHTTVCAMRLL